MDWSHVTAAEVASALREVDWKSPPRLLWEMLQPSRFTVPRSRKKWAARAKNSAYYYRVNYALMLLVCALTPLFRRPTGLLAIAAVALAVLCHNDIFATFLSDLLIRSLRRVNVRLAQKIRASTGSHSSNGPGDQLPGSRRKGVTVCGVPRSWVAAGLGLLGAMLLQRSRALLTFAWSLLLGVSLVALHATFRSPNLKARLGSAREEFRALWRGYQEADAIIDYTL